MARYTDAVEWIARNDEGGEMDPAEVETMISVLLTADLWGKEPGDVARDVVRKRRLLNKRGTF